jgi:DnaK suppressor protein
MLGFGVARFRGTLVAFSGATYLQEGAMKTMAGSDEGKRYEVLNKMLLDRQADIKGKLHLLREIMPAKGSDVKDVEELSMEDFVRDMDVALLVMESETLKRIDEALRRLNDGTYGVCASCEEPIAEARLQALPFAVRCRDCQERAELEDDGAYVSGRRPHYEEPPSKVQAALARERAVLQADSAVQSAVRNARNRA